jgi:putative transposase
MYKKRSFIEGAFYHVTSRTNDKIRVFENNLGRKIMLIVLQNAKDKFRFCLTNFCVMPTHIHLLIKPAEKTNLSVIMQWIKINSAKYWNRIHGSIDHLWGSRFFARAIKDPNEYDFVMNYIDQNAVVVGLAPTPADWKASGAYYKVKNLPGLIDFSPNDRQPYIKLLSPIPPIVSRLIPPRQLAYLLQYYGPHAADVERLYRLIPTIPRIGESAHLHKPPICLHYTTGTADYFIYEYDGADTIFGLCRSNVFPTDSEYDKFSLTALKTNQYMKLDLSWVVPGTSLQTK